MPQNRSSKRRPTTAAAVVLLLVLASVVLAACGSSSKSSSTTTSTSASASTTTTGKAPGAGGSRFSALRECLEKDGITLPKFTPGQRPSPTNHGPLLPKGVSKAQYEAAIKKCGGNFGGGGRDRFDSAALKQALTKFAACMRENGVNIPKANTSGKGPIFDTKGLNTSSATFKAADAKCRTDLGGAFRGAPGAHGGPGSGSGAGPGAGAPASAG
jgi:hypothetical protein